MWGTRAQGASVAGVVVGVSLIAGMTMAQAPENPFAGECNRTATAEEIEGARGAHQAARQFYDRAEYARAIQYWRDVFNFDCNAVGTLLNLANAYERLGERDNAIYALEAYVKRNPDGANIQKIETRIANLKALQQKAAASASASTSATAPPPTASSAAPPPPPPPMVKPYGVGPWVLVGTGAAAMVVGGILVPVGLGAVSDAQASCTQSSPGKWSCPTQADLDNAQFGQTVVPVGKAALGIGAAAVVGGLVWEFVFNKPAPEATPESSSTGRVRVAPAVGPGMTGAVVHGTF